MKKILSVFIILLICTALVACGGAEQGGTPGSSGTSDTQQTGATTQPASKIPPAQPEKPEGLTERVRYECSEEGFYAVYEYCDARGNAVQEHYYAIDPELGILDCRILAYNTYDGGGNIVTSEGHYMQNPYYGTYDTVLTIQALHGMEYDYSVSDAQGNVQLYIKQSTDAQGRAVKEEYYGMRGRYIRSEEWTYHAGGAVKEHKSTDARGRTKLLCEYDENGNFTKCTVYDAAGRARTVHTAEYSGSTLVKHTVSGYSESGGLTGTTETRFDEKGRITERPGCRYVYTEDGRLTQVIKNVVNTYSFNEKGYVIEYRGSVMGSATTHITTSYSYDSLGRLSAVSTRNQYGIHRSSVAYTYDADGACKVVHTNEYGIENYMVYTDEYGRVIKEETYNNVRRTKHYTYSYDSYGRLTESVYYDKDKKKEVITYTYNDHGDLIREDTLSYQSSGFTYNTYVTYDYYADGSLRSMDRYGSDGFRESGREYYEDGGYTVYTYGFDDEMIRAETYDIGGNNIRSEYNENGENQVVTREFYGFEKEKTVFYYINGLLVRGYEYAEDGSLFKEHERNEKGVVVTTQILRGESGNVIRKDVWHDNVYAGYTE
jgi:hypothetical protein